MSFSSETIDRVVDFHGHICPGLAIGIRVSELFDVSPADAPAPRPARILDSLAFESCGEMTMESRTRRFDGRTLCIPCFEAIEQKV